MIHIAMLKTHINQPTRSISFLREIVIISRTRWGSAPKKINPEHIPYKRYEHRVVEYDRQQPVRHPQPTIEEPVSVTNISEKDKDDNWDIEWIQRNGGL